MELLTALLEQRGVDFVQLEEGAISFAFQSTLSDGQEQVFSVFALPLENRFGDSYTRFTIVPFLEKPPDGYPTELYDAVAQANHQALGLKFAIDDDGDLELLVDIPREHLDEAEIDHTIQVLADHAGVYYPVLGAIVSNRTSLP